MRTDVDSSVIQCGCWTILVAFNVSVGAWSVNYLLHFFLDKTIPFLGAAAIGLFSAQLTVPVAIIVWILKSFNVL